MTHPEPMQSEPMRWFTDAAEEADSTEWDLVLADYQRHLADIGSRLTVDVALLATEPELNLHDAAIRELLVDRPGATVEMTVDLADRTMRLVFRGARIVPDDFQALAYAVGAVFRTEHWGDATTVIRAQEIDVGSEGRFVLRLRLWPFHAFAIEFADLALRLEPRRGRRQSPGHMTIL